MILNTVGQSPLGAFIQSALGVRTIEGTEPPLLLNARYLFPNSRTAGPNGPVGQFVGPSDPFPGPQLPAGGHDLGVIFHHGYVFVWGSSFERITGRHPHAFVYPNPVFNSPIDNIIYDVVVYNGELYVLLNNRLAESIVVVFRYDLATDSLVDTATTGNVTGDAVSDAGGGFYDIGSALQVLMEIGAGASPGVNKVESIAALVGTSWETTIEYSASFANTDVHGSIFFDGDYFAGGATRVRPTFSILGPNIDVTDPVGPQEFLAIDTTFAPAPNSARYVYETKSGSGCGITQWNNKLWGSGVHTTATALQSALLSFDATGITHEVIIGDPLNTDPFTTDAIHDIKVAGTKLFVIGNFSVVEVVGGAVGPQAASFGFLYDGTVIEPFNLSQRLSFGTYYIPANDPEPHFNPVPAGGQALKDIEYQRQLTFASGVPTLYEITQGGDGAVVSPTGLVTWTPQAGAPNPQAFTAYASNAGGYDYVSWSLDVFTEVPVITTIIPNRTAAANAFHFEDLLATGSTPVLWELIEGPPISGQMNGFSDVLNHRFFYRGDLQPDLSGVYTVTVRCSNPLGFDEISWQLTLT